MSSPIPVFRTIFSGIPQFFRLLWVMPIWIIAAYVFQVAFVLAFKDLITQSLTAPTGDGPPLSQLSALGNVWNVLVGAFQFLVYSAVFGNAVIRSVIEPSVSGVGYLHFGPAERWVAINVIVQLVMYVSGLVILSFLVAGPVASVIATELHGMEIVTIDGANAVAFVVGAVFGLAYGVFVGGRLFLSSAVTVDTNSFGVFKGWSVSRALGWRLFAIVFGYTFLVWLFFGASLGLGAYFSTQHQFSVLNVHSVDDLLAPTTIAYFFSVSVLTIFGTVLLATPIGRAYLFAKQQGIRGDH